MKASRSWMIGGFLMLAVVVACLLSARLQFMLGGAFVNAGYRLQDHLHVYDLDHEHPDPSAVWQELLRHNAMAAGVRAVFPRSTEHPLVALLVCMDARIDTSEVVGDTRRYYYIVRTAGSVLAPAEQEMLELAVINGVRVIVLTTHTDCAAEAVAASPEQRAQFPELVRLLDMRELRIAEFKSRPVIRQALSQGKLLIQHARIDTTDDRLIPMSTSTAFRYGAPAP